MKLTKPLIFISGFIAGVVYCLYRDVLSKPVEPKVEVKTLYNMSFGEFIELLEFVRIADMNSVKIAEHRKALDDTQPVYIGEPENEWKPEPWHDDIGGM